MAVAECLATCAGNDRRIAIKQVVDVEANLPVAAVRHFPAIVHTHVEDGLRCNSVVIHIHAFHPVGVGAGEPFVVTVAQRAVVVGRLQHEAEIGNVESVVFGHIADGNLHIFVRPSSEQAYAELNEHEEVNKIVYGSLKNYGGSVSAEHGIGLEKMAWLNINRSHSEVNLMRSIKSALDPKNLLNPGKVFSSADL